MDLTNRNFIISKQIRVDPYHSKIVIDAQEANVEPRLMKLLVLLCEHAGKEYSRSELVEQIWNNKWIGEEGLTKAISQLRKILKDPYVIRTIPKHGYSFVGKISFDENPQLNIRSQISRIALPILVIVLILIISMFSSVEFTEPTLRENASFQYSYLTDHKGLYLSPAISSNGELVAYVERKENDKRFKLLVKSVASREVIFELATEGRDYEYPVFSPSGEWIAFVSKENGYSYLCTARVGYNKVKYIHQLDNKSNTQVDWSPKNNLLVYNDLDSNMGHHNLFVYDFTNEQIQQITHTDLDEMNPVFSSDGLRVAFIQKGKNRTRADIAILDLTRNTHEVVKEIPSGIYDLDWGDHDQSIMFTSNNGYESMVYSLNLLTGLTAQVDNQSFYQLAVKSNQNQFVASKYSSDNNIYLKSLTSFDSPPVSILNSSRYEIDGVISPDNSKIAYVTDISGSFQIWEYSIETMQSRQVTFVEGQKKFDKISWSPTGDELLVGYKSVLGSKIVSVSLDKEEVTVLIDDDFINRFPQYDISGNEFYFLSDKSGKTELWNYDLLTKSVKKNSNICGELSYARINVSDSTMYFTEVDKDGLWKTSLEGGEFIKVLCLDARDYSIWELFDDGIYFIDRTVPNSHAIKYHNFANLSEEILVSLLGGNQSYNTKFSISNDRSAIIFNQIDHFESDIVFLKDNATSTGLLKAQLH